MSRRYSRRYESPPVHERGQPESGYDHFRAGVARTPRLSVANMNRPQPNPHTNGPRTTRRMECPDCQRNWKKASTGKSCFGCCCSAAGNSCIAGRQERHRRCPWNSGVPGLRVDQHGPIERRWTRSCTLVVYRTFQLGVRSGERRPRRHRDFRDRNFVGAKYEAER